MKFDRFMDSKRRVPWTRRAISAVWFVAIAGTLFVAAVEPLLGLPVALGLIFLSIVFPGESSCARSDGQNYC